MDDIFYGSKVSDYERDGEWIDFLMGKEIDPMQLTPVDELPDGEGIYEPKSNNIPQNIKVDPVTPISTGDIYASAWDKAIEDASRTPDCMVTDNSAVIPSTSGPIPVVFESAVQFGGPVAVERIDIDNTEVIALVAETVREDFKRELRHFGMGLLAIMAVMFAAMLACSLIL